MALVIHTLNGIKKFIAWIFAKIIYLWGRSLRISVANNSLHILQEVQSQSKICATWHHNLLITPEVFRKFCHNTKMYGLISPSKDGSWGSYILNQFNINTIRGSSKRGGVSAFLSMQRALQNEICAVTFTPDGPRGPRCVLKNGIIKLAKISNVPIILMTAKFSNAKNINSWDKMKLPLPFSKVVIEFQMINVKEINSLSFDDLKLKVQNLLSGN